MADHSENQSAESIKKGNPLRYGTGKSAVEQKTEKSGNVTLIGKIKTVKQGTTGTWDFIKKSFKICVEHITEGPCPALCGISLFCLFGRIFPAVEIILGATYIYDCPIDQKIPIYLIVAGALGFLLGLLFGCVDTRPKGLTEKRDELKDDNDNNLLNFVECTLLMFAVVWTIAGAVWVFDVATIWEPDSQTPITNGTVRYCNPILYRVSVGSVLLQLVVSGTVVILMLVFCASIYRLASGQNEVDEKRLIFSNDK